MPEKVCGIFNNHISLQFLKITFLIAIEKSLWKLPPPPFTGCCQKEMNNVFEIFTNIRCGWGSSLWEPEIYSTFSLWTSLNKSYSQLCLLQCLTATPDVEINSLSLLSSFSPCWSHLFPILGPGDEVWKICWTLLSSSESKVLGHTSRSRMQYLCDTCFPQSPCLLVGMQPPQGDPVGWYQTWASAISSY